MLCTELVQEKTFLFREKFLQTYAKAMPNALGLTAWHMGSASARVHARVNVRVRKCMLARICECASARTCECVSAQVRAFVRVQVRECTHSRVCKGAHLEMRK